MSQEEEGDASETTEEHDLDEVEIEHTYSNDYDIIHADGVTGGVQPKGDVKIDFTVDLNRRVTKETVETDGEQISFTSGMTFEPNLRREHQVGVMMSQSETLRTGCWMISLFYDEFDENDIYEIVTRTHEQHVAEDENE